MAVPLTGKDRNEVGKRYFYRDSSPERPRARLGSFPRSGDAQPEQTGQRVYGSRAVLLTVRRSPFAVGRFRLVLEARSAE
jgi:hypothetical protein